MFRFKACQVQWRVSGQVFPRGPERREHGGETAREVLTVPFSFCWPPCQAHLGTDSERPVVAHDTEKDSHQRWGQVTTGVTLSPDPQAHSSFPCSNPAAAFSPGLRRLWGVLSAPSPALVGEHTSRACVQPPRLRVAWTCLSGPGVVRSPQALPSRPCSFLRLSLLVNDWGWKGQLRRRQLLGNPNSDNFSRTCCGPHECDRPWSGHSGCRLAGLVTVAEQLDVGDEWAGRVPPSSPIPCRGAAPAEQPTSAVGVAPVTSPEGAWEGSHSKIENCMKSIRCFYGLSRVS